MKLTSSASMLQWPYMPGPIQIQLPKNTTTKYYKKWVQSMKLTSSASMLQWPYMLGPIGLRFRSFKRTLSMLRSSSLVFDFENKKYDIQYDFQKNTSHAEGKSLVFHSKKKNIPHFLNCSESEESGSHSLHLKYSFQQCGRWWWKCRWPWPWQGRGLCTWSQRLWKWCWLWRFCLWKWWKSGNNGRTCFCRPPPQLVL